MCIYIYIYIYISPSLSLSIYIYIYVERERDITIYYIYIILHISESVSHETHGSQMTLRSSRAARPAKVCAPAFFEGPRPDARLVPRIYYY